MKLLCIKELTPVLQRELFLLKEDCEKQTGKTYSWNPEESDGESEMRYYLIYDDNLLISSLIVTLFSQSDSLYFDFFAMTKPEYQRQGYFTDLFDALLEDLEKEFDDRPWISELYIDKENVPANFLESFDYEKGASEYLMEKPYFPTNIQNPLNLSLQPTENYKALSSYYSEIFGVTKEQAAIAFEGLSHFKTWYFIKKDDTAVGIVLLMEEKESTYLCNFGILPEYRRNHLGSMALNIIEQQEKKIITLQVSGTNPAAFSLYKKNGYQITKEFLHYYQEF